MRIVKRKCYVEVVDCDGRSMVVYPQLRRARNGAPPMVEIAGKVAYVDNNAQLLRLGEAIAALARRNMEVGDD